MKIPEQWLPESVRCLRTYSRHDSVRTCWRRSGKTLLLCGARDQPARLLHKAEFIEHIGRDNVVAHVEAALQRAAEINAAFGGVGQEMAEDFERSPL